MSNFNTWSISVDTWNYPANFQDSSNYRRLELQKCRIPKFRVVKVLNRHVLLGQCLNINIFCSIMCV